MTDLPQVEPLVRDSNRTFLAFSASRIKELCKKTCENIVAIGRHLTKCQGCLGHGAWLPWLEREFGWSDQTARNFMRVYEMSKSKNFLDLDLPVSSLYLLAAPSTAENARTEVIERANSGEAVVCSIALQYGVPLDVIRKALLRDARGVRQLTARHRARYRCRRPAMTACARNQISIQAAFRGAIPVGVIEMIRTDIIQNIRALKRSDAERLADQSFELVIIALWRDPGLPVPSSNARWLALADARQRFVERIHRRVHGHVHIDDAGAEIERRPW